MGIDFEQNPYWRLSTSRRTPSQPNNVIRDAVDKGNQPALGAPFSNASQSGEAGVTPWDQVDYQLLYSQQTARIPVTPVYVDSTSSVVGTVGQSGGVGCSGNTDDNSKIQAYDQAQSLNELEQNTSIIKDYLGVKYSNLFESGVLDDKLTERIISNSFAFVALNRNNTDLDELSLFKNCIKAQLRLSIIANELGLDKEEYINQNLADYMVTLCNSRQPDGTIPNYTAAARRSTRAASTDGGNSKNNNYADNIPENIINYIKEIYGNNIKLEYDSTASSDDFVVFKVINDMNERCMLTLNDQTYYSFYYGTVYSTIESKFSLEGDFLNSDVSITDVNKWFEAISNGTFGVDDFKKLSFVDIIRCLGNTTASVDMIQNGFTSLNNLSSALKGMENETKECLINALSKMNYSDLLDLLKKGDSSIENILSIAYFANSRRIRENNDGFCWNVNGVLFDEKNKQGGVGDCWFLAGNISMSNSKALIDVLKNQILSYDKETQTYTVTIQGKKYTYTYEQLKNATELSNGDLDVRALEMAAIEYFNSKSGSSPMVTGAWLATLSEFYTGINSCNSVDSLNNASQIIDDVKSGEYIGTISTMTKGIKVVDAVTGEEVEFITQHAYAVVGATDDGIYIINPWDSSRLLKLDKKTLNENSFIYESLSIEGLIEDITVANYEPVHLNNYDYKLDKIVDKIEKDKIQYKDGSYDIIIESNNKTEILMYDEGTVYSKLIIEQDDDGTKSVSAYDSDNDLRRKEVFYPDGSKVIYDYWGDNSTYEIQYFDKDGHMYKEESYVDGVKYEQSSDKVKDETENSNNESEVNQSTIPNEQTPPLAPTNPNAPYIDNLGHYWPTYIDCKNCQTYDIPYEDFIEAYNSYINTQGLNNNTNDNNTDNGSQNTDVYNENYMPWGPGNPDWDSLYGDLMGGNTELPSPEYVIGNGSVNYSNFINSGTIGVEAVRTVWPTMSKEEHATWLSNYATQLLQERYGVNGDINVYVTIDENGILQWTVTSSSTAIDVVELNNMLNKLENDSSRDLASLTGAGGGYIDVKNDGEMETVTKNTETYLDSYGYMITKVTDEDGNIDFYRNGVLAWSYDKENDHYTFNIDTYANDSGAIDVRALLYDWISNGLMAKQYEGDNARFVFSELKDMNLKEFESWWKSVLYTLDTYNDEMVQKLLGIGKYSTFNDTDPWTAIDANGGMLTYVPGYGYIIPGFEQFYEDWVREEQQSGGGNEDEARGVGNIEEEFLPGIEDEETPITENPENDDEPDLPSNGEEDMPGEDEIGLESDG